MKNQIIFIALIIFSLSCKEEEKVVPVTPETTFDARVYISSGHRIDSLVYANVLIDTIDIADYYANPNLDYDGNKLIWVDTVNYSKGVNHTIKAVTVQSGPPSSTYNTIVIKVFNNKTGAIIVDSTITDPNWNTSGNAMYYTSTAVFKVD